MKPPLLLVETKCPGGHVQLYRSQIRDYCADYDVTLATTQAYSENFADLGIAFREIPDTGKVPGGKIGRKILQARRLTPMLRRWRQEGFDKCVVLSFDTHVLGLVSLIVSVRDVSFFMHNNVDEILTSRSKRACFRLIPRSATFLVFEEYIAESLRTRFGVNAQAVFHERRVAQPANPPDLRPAGERKYVFSPSTECDPVFLTKLIAFCRENDLLLLTKPQPNLPESPDIIVQRRFDNYDDLLVHAEYVACGVDYQYRISGVLLEALGNRKKIVANDCILVRHLKEKAEEELIVLNEKHPHAHAGTSATHQA